MSEQQESGDALPPATLAMLLESALRARKQGNLPASRALLRALTVQQPSSAQVWLALASVAETRVEQRQALERVIALDPQNHLAQRGLARIAGDEAPANRTATAATPAEPATTAAPVPPTEQPTEQRRAAGVTPVLAELAPEPVLEPPAIEVAPGPTLTASPQLAEPESRPIRWPLYLIIALSVLAVLVATAFIRGPELFRSSGSQPTPALANLATELPAVVAPLPPTPTVDVVTALPALLATATLADQSSTPASAASGAAATAPPATAAAEPTVEPEPVAQQSLPPGEVIKQGQWHAILIRPQDAVALDGSIGSLQPRGRFVLALVAIGNDGQAPARLPADMFAVVDSSGQRYAPEPAISTAYLNSYGRGQHGDLSMEDTIPADGGNRSIPLIFDVPANARGLSLVVGNSPLGWAVGQ